MNSALALAYTSSFVGLRKMLLVACMLWAASAASALQPTVVASGLSGPPLVMAVDGEFLYFRASDGSSDFLYRIPKALANLTLATLPPPIVSAPSQSGGINDLAFDASNIFVHIGGYGNGYIWRLPKTLVNGSFLVSTIGGAMIGVIGSNMYFTHGNSGSIARIATSETNSTNFQDISNPTKTYFLRQKTLDASSIFFTDLDNGTNLARFDIARNTEVWRTAIPSEGTLVSDDTSLYLSPGYVSAGVLKGSKQTGQLQTLISNANGAYGHAVGGGYFYYVENSVLRAMPVGGGAAIDLASPVDVHNAVYDNGMLYWAPAVGTTVYSLSVAGMLTTVPFSQPTLAITPPSGKGKNLAVVIHGWNSSTSEPWVGDMVDKICKRLGSSASVSYPTQPDIPIHGCTTSSWDVKSLDWRYSAGRKLVPDCLLAISSNGSTPPTCPIGTGTSLLPVTPWEAWVNASPIGENLAELIQFGGYQHVHLIGHSAGSNVAQRAIEVAKANRDKTIGCALPQPPTTCSYPQSVHLTFLDAYDPSGLGSRYGSGATWADQYVDIRPLFPVWLLGEVDTTNTNLLKSFNFDVTTLDVRQEPYLVDSVFQLPLGTWTFNMLARMVTRHAWPYDYYACSILSPPFNSILPDGVDCTTISSSSITNFGFGLSVEAASSIVSNAMRFPVRTADGKAHSCGPPFNVTCSTWNSTPVNVVVSPFFPVLGSTPVVSQTGTANTTPTFIGGSSLSNIQVELISGSPAWIALPFQTQDRLDAIQFDATFTSQAEGLLTIAVDGRIAFMTDERFSGLLTRTSTRIPLRNLAAGPHTLMIRLDPFNAKQSRVIIANIQAFRTDIIQLPVPVGDLNSDGKVDCGDLAIVKASFGKRSTQLGFDIRADINKDGIVDVRDLSYIAQKLPAGTICQ